MKTNLWIWVLSILLILTFLGLCTGISLAADEEIKFTSTLNAEETYLPPEGQADFAGEAVVKEQTEMLVQEPAVQIEQAQQTESSTSESDIAETTEQPIKDEKTTLYIIIGALGVLLLIIVIIIFSILNKNRHRD